MKYFSSQLRLHRLALILCCSALISPFGFVFAQSGSGQGTVDPNSVTVTRTVDFTFGPNNEIGTGLYATDRAGNYYLHNSIGSSQWPSPIISKFSHDGQLLYRRQRSLTVVHVVNGGADTYYEQWSPNTTSVQIGYNDYAAALELESLVVDDQGNLFAVFDEINTTSSCPSCPFPHERTLIVKFDANGVFQWRHVTPDDNGSAPGTNHVKKAVLSANGSIVTAIAASNPSGSKSNTHAAALKYGADGSRVFNVSLETGSSPQDLASDSAGNLFFMVTSPSAKTIRRLDTNGNVTATITQPPVAAGTAYDVWEYPACDSAGNLYVAGEYLTGARNSTAYENKQLVLKFDNNLNLLWRATTAQDSKTTAPFDASVMGIGLSPGGATVVSYSRTEPRAWETTRFSPDNGHIIWHQVYYPSPASDGSTSATYISKFYVASNDDVFITGGIPNPNGLGSTVLGKYAGNGDLQFIKAIKEDASTLLPGVAYRPTFYGQATQYEAYINEYSNPADVYVDPSYRPQLGAIGSFVVRGPFSDAGPITFTASGPTGVTMRVQFSTDPNIKTDGNESSWTDLFDGGVMTEDPKGSGNYSLISNAYPSGSNISFRAIASQPGYKDSKSTPLSGYTLHRKPGLAPTAFQVNENSKPTAGLADTVLRFAAVQTARAAGLRVRVQASTDGSTWKDLPNGGWMAYDKSNGLFVLHTTSYPAGAAVSFRGISSANGFNDSMSDPIGPFNLSSNKPHLAAPTLVVTANDPIAPGIYFRSTTSALPSGGSVRVQISSTPFDETSWQDITNGQMQPRDVADNFWLIANNLAVTPTAYFRAVATAPGYVDGISGICPGGDIAYVVPPSVIVVPPAGLAVGGGDGSSPDNPMVFPWGVALPFLAVAQTDRTLVTLELHCNHFVGAARFDELPKKSFTYTVDQIPLGDYTVTGVAVDDRNVTGAPVGKSVLYIQIVPPRGGAKAERASGTAGSAEVAPGKLYNVANSGGRWFNPNTWVDANGNHGVPNRNDFAIIGANTVYLDLSPTDLGDPEVGSLSLNGGFIVGGSLELHIFHNLTVRAGHFEGEGLIRLVSGCVGNLSNSEKVVFKQRDGFGASTGTFFIDAGATLNVQGTGGISGAQAIHNDGAVNWNVPAGGSPNIGARVASDLRELSAVKFTGGGTIKGPQILGSRLISNDGSSLISNDGSSLISNDGSSVISNDGSTVISNDGSTLVPPPAYVLPNGGNVISNSVAVVSDNGLGIISDGSSLALARGGNVISGNGSALGPIAQDGTSTTKAGATTANAASASASIQMTGGEIDLTSCTIIGDLQMDGGLLSGSGGVVGSVMNNGGYIMPGSQGRPGSIDVAGNFTQAAKGTTILESGGYLPGLFDRLNVAGAGNLGGTLDVKTINGYTPGTQDVYVPLSFSSVSGAFSKVSSNANVTVTSRGVLSSVDVTKPNPGTGQPLNISTRMNVLTGDNVLIGGFIVYDPTGAGASKKVIIRALGPSVPASGTLSDPLLILHGGPNGDITNDNWQQGDTSQIPGGFTPGDPRESVIVATLPPGVYTAEVRGAHGETGIGLVELYDLNSSATAKLANISTRGFVDTGDNVMIGGFIVGGRDPNNPLTGEPGKVLVRGIGPSLTKSGVKGALTATTLELHDSNGAAIGNQGWRSTQETEIIATTIPPENDQDSAILAILPPGTYTAVLRGANGTTGIGLIEAYNLQ